MDTCVELCLFADMKLDCRDDHVIVVLTVRRPQVDPLLFRLGSCLPDSVTHREAVFNVHLNDCGFTRLVRNCSAQTLWCRSCSAVWRQFDVFCRSLGIRCCTATIWLTTPLPKPKLHHSLVNQSSVNMIGEHMKQMLWLLTVFDALDVFSIQAQHQLPFDLWDRVWNLWFCGSGVPPWTHEQWVPNVLQLKYSCSF